jgi:DNA-binding NarL/FixJ family response regulator
MPADLGAGSRHGGEMISVAVCELQPIVVEGLRAILRDAADLELEATFASLEQAFPEVRSRRFDVVLADRAFGLHALLDWLGRLRRECPESQVVIWSGAMSDVESFRMLQAGARGILRKGSSVAALLHCLRTVAGRELWTESLFNQGGADVASGRTRPLTPREQQVADLVANGMKNREIAETLQIATGTVKIHLMHIFEKTGIRDRFELALHGLRLATSRTVECSPEPAAEAVESFPGAFRRQE